MVPFERVCLIVLDSVGIGAAPDAHRFGDEKANTLKHIAEWCVQNKKLLSLPNLSRWGLGNFVEVNPSLTKNSKSQASTARLRELSPGKDTTTGHWEMAGSVLTSEFPIFPNGFSEALLQQWVNECSLPGWLGNKPASGTEILTELGELSIQTGKPIVYTSGDSVFQIAAHEEFFGLKRLYEICQSARRLLDPLGVGRIIARPFLGTNKSNFKRTENRRDLSVPPPYPNMLDLLVEQKHFTYGVGKIEDIFAHRGLTQVDHTGRNETSCEATLKALENTRGQKGLIFTNLIDFDQLHGHRRNPSTYADALMDFDRFLPRLEAACGENDLLVLTADHGNDPTHSGTDHTREDVPLLFWSPRKSFVAKHHESAIPGFSAVAILTLEALGLQSEIVKLSGANSSPSFGVLKTNV
jgi:phosphopentomutase